MWATSEFAPVASCWHRGEINLGDVLPSTAKIIYKMRINAKPEY
jgi:hypothetical protein